MRIVCPPFVLRYLDSASLTLSFSQTMICLSSSCASFFFNIYIYTSSALLLQHQSYWRVLQHSWQVKIFSYSHKREDNNFQKRWMDGNNSWQIYGDFLPVEYLTSTNKARLCSHLICYRWCGGNPRIIMNATCGCRLPSGSQTKPHYHKKLMLSSVRFSSFVFNIIVAKCSLMCCFCIALLRAAVYQALDWILKFKFYFTSGMPSNRALTV